jgi:HEAT repeat protein
LCKLAYDADAVTRSSAVAALGEIGGAAAVAVLRRALCDPDPRVQANAIEGLDRLEAPGREDAMRQRMSSPHPRVQANSVAGLLQLHVFEAGPALLSMLEDASPARRLSGLWVVDRLKLVALLDKVRMIADGDGDGRVRQRADNVLHQLVEADESPPPELLVNEGRAAG